MRPRLIALIVAATFVGVMTTLVLPVGLLWHAARQQVAQERFQVMVADQNAMLFDAIPQRQVVQQVAPEQIKEVRGAVAEATDVKISGPFAHNNLGIFLIHGPDTLKDRPFLTLHEAMARNEVQVQDRGGVAMIHNRSDRDLFIQSGDIIKGGCQDRTIEYDQLIPPRSPAIPVAILCVEQGRSTPRRGESAADFLSAAEQLPTRSLRLANLYRNSQQDVWNGVRDTQNRLSRNVGGSVQPSTFSLQLTLENERVQQAVQEYLTPLALAAEDKNDVIGLAVAVNGKIHSADVYASNALFQKLWPKLLRASAIEALSERTASSARDVPSTDAVEAFLRSAQRGNGTRRDVSSQVRLVSQDSPRTVLFDTCDMSRDNLVLHRCVLAK